LVENAVAHGIAPRQGRGCVRVNARARDGGVEVSVVDDGVGVPADQLGRVLQRGFGTGLGMGLNNVHQRLIGAYGPASGLQIESSPRGTTVAFWVPGGTPSA
jgi:two-component system LytT family sensor kinase